MKWNFDNTYARLPDFFFSRVDPVPVSSPKLLIFNHALAADLGLQPVDLEAFAHQVTGNLPMPGAEPIAQAYAGHQFGGFTMLGDGRALLLGEHVTADGRRVDIQVKGSGPTPYSRRGDGRAALGPMLREFLISEAMHALKLPTTRALAVVATGEPVFREEALPGAVLVRVASSHIRVGTFECAAARGRADMLAVLLDHTVDRHFPALAHLARAEKALGLLRECIRRQADLIAGWMAVGFIHGVMNTDNSALSGETLDYGPCAFMDEFDPATVFSSIDTHGRYAYGNQPRIGQWNAGCLAQALLPLLEPERGQSAAIDLLRGQVESFAEAFERSWRGRMLAKIGVSLAAPEDFDLVRDLLAIMHARRADFTDSFRALMTIWREGNDHKLQEHPDFPGWLKRWRSRLERESDPLALMRESNPLIIPRNHLVEEALAAARNGDLGKVEALFEAWKKPFSADPLPAEFRAPPPRGRGAYRTFCGT